MVDASTSRFATPNPTNGGQITTSTPSTACKTGYISRIKSRVSDNPLFIFQLPATIGVLIGFTILYDLVFLFYHQVAGGFT
jgi:hypothetical protein